MDIRVSHTGLVQFAPCLSDDGSSRGNTQSSHQHRHCQIRPCTTGPGNQAGGRNYGHISNRVVATAKPYRLHVRVAFTPFVKHQSYSHIGNECQHRYHAHGQRFRNLPCPKAIRRVGQNAYPENSECGTFNQGCLCTNRQCHAQHKKGNSVVRCITKKSSESANRETEPAFKPEATSTMNIPKLTTRATHNTFL